MNKLEDPIDEGWIVHVYGRNRRLLCALEPSHGWTFLAGLGLGLLLAITGYNITGNSTDSEESATRSLTQPPSVPWSLD